MPLRVAAPKRLGREPLWTLGEPVETLRVSGDPLNTPALFQLWGGEYKRDERAVRMGRRFWLTAGG